MVHNIFLTVKSEDFTQQFRKCLWSVATVRDWITVNMDSLKINSVCRYRSSHNQDVVQELHRQLYEEDNLFDDQMYVDIKVKLSMIISVVNRCCLPLLWIVAEALQWLTARETCSSIWKQKKKELVKQKWVNFHVLFVSLPISRLSMYPT